MHAHELLLESNSARVISAASLQARNSVRGSRVSPPRASDAVKIALSVECNVFSDACLTSVGLGIEPASPTSLDCFVSFKAFLHSSASVAPFSAANINGARPNAMDRANGFMMLK